MLISCYRKIANLWTFLIIFCLCFFLETFTFTYLISAIQSIERQFQIPSKMSGTLVSAGDIGYILTVVLLSYFGSRGNRARFIGAGCILIAFACLLISLPYFIFRPAPPMASNLSFIREIVKPPADILDPEVDPRKLLDYPPVKMKMPEQIRTLILYKFDPDSAPSDFGDLGLVGDADYSDYYENYGETMDEEQVENATSLRVRREAEPTPDYRERMKAMIFALMMDRVTVRDVIHAIQQKLAEPPPDQLLKRIQWAAGMPFGHCSIMINKFKSRIREWQCQVEQTNEIAFGMVFIGIMMIGVGHSMPWSLGVPLIDDNVKKSSTPFYFAFIFFIRILGPVLGFVIGGACTKLYYNFKPPPGLTPLDPRWIGSWWLGFLIIFGALLFPSILLFCFPSNVSEKPTQEQSADNRANGEPERIVEPTLMEDSEEGVKKKKKHSVRLTDQHRKKSIQNISFFTQIKNFGIALFIVLKCPVYTGALIGRLFDAFAFKGFFVFLPKYLENHYGIPQFKANLFLAVQGVVGFAIGIALGSLIMRKLKLEGRKAAIYVGLCSLISGAISFGNVGIGCHSVVNQIGKTGLQNGFNFTNACNQDCACETVSLFPVCSEIGTPYYSPCVAGCGNMTMIDKTTMKITFSGCSCIDEGDAVSRDWCSDDCGTPMIVYFVLMITSGLISGTAVIPGILIVLRSVPPEYRSVALGFSAFAVSLLSTFPSPIVYGFIIDSSCLLWNEECGHRGSCVMYDPSQLRHRMHLFSGALRCTALLFDIWVWYWAKDLKLMEETPEGEEDAGTQMRKLTIEAANPAEIGSVSKLSST